MLVQPSAPLHAVEERRIQQLTVKEDKGPARGPLDMFRQKPIDQDAEDAGVENLGVHFEVSDERTTGLETCVVSPERREQQLPLPQNAWPFGQVRSSAKKSGRAIRQREHKEVGSPASR